MHSKLQEQVKASNGMFSFITCPCCGKETLDSFYICDNCYWEYDGVRDDLEYSDVNRSTLLEYRKSYLSSKLV